MNRLRPYLPEEPKLGSLFDGISGFCVVWAEAYGTDNCRWASEIEEFPIAVSKKHFGDELAGIKGDYDEKYK